jgi:hypothetical protein
MMIYKSIIFKLINNENMFNEFIQNKPEKCNGSCFYLMTLFMFLMIIPSILLIYKITYEKNKEKHIIDTKCVADNIIYNLNGEIFSGGECITNGYIRFHSNRGESSYSRDCKRIPIVSYDPKRYLYLPSSVNGYTKDSRNIKLTYENKYFRGSFTNLDCIVSANSSIITVNDCIKYVDFRCFIYKENAYPYKTLISNTNYGTYWFLLIMSLILFVAHPLILFYLSYRNANNFYKKFNNADSIINLDSDYVIS